MTSAYKQTLPLPQKQQGIVIIMALVILMILSILGVSSMTSSTMEERMSSNVRDRHVAFQAAEAALRHAEREIESATFSTVDETDFFDYKANNGTTVAQVCTNGLCNCSDAQDNSCTAVADATVEADPDAADYWSNSTIDVWNTSTRHRTYAVEFTEVAAKPKYIIEFMNYIAPEGSPTGYDPVIGDPEMFRITALGFGRSLNARVMLQSTYKRVP